MHYFIMYNKLRLVGEWRKAFDFVRPCDLGDFLGVHLYFHQDKILQDFETILNFKAC